jgi:histidinol-phosphate aminotransferase
LTFQFEAHPKRSLEKLAPYEALPSGVDLPRGDLVVMNANESPYGPSPRALEGALGALKGGVNRYPDPSARDLTGALSAHWGVEEDRILVDNGLDGVITLLGITFLEEGDQVLHGEVTFSVYKSLAMRLGAVSVPVPMGDRWELDLEGFLQRIADRTRLVFVCNPNNPTGTLVSHRRMEEFMSLVPRRVLVVSDEAYGDFAGDDLPRTLELMERYPNLIMMRTFSKAYGLAGLRVGYLIAHPSVVMAMRRAKEPYGVNAVALGAALGALEDREHLRRTVEALLEGRRFLEEGLERLKVPFVRSHANFVFMPLGDRAGDVFRGLVARGVLVRLFDSLGAIRVSVGTPKENLAFLKALSEVICDE